MAWDVIDILQAAKRMEKLLKENPAANGFQIAMDRKMALLFLDYLHSMDPDMPPRPVAKALGPLVGDIMTNEKLNRLNSLIDVLGPITIRLQQVADQMESRRG